MILDASKVSMQDGTRLSAMEVVAGREILSYQNRRFVRGRILDKKVEHSADVVGLILDSGRKFCGSRDQLVAAVQGKQIRFVPLQDVTIGDRLRGEVAGMPVSVGVTGLMFYPRQQMRLVGFQLDHDKAFVAEGILCRGGDVSD